MAKDKKIVKFRTRREVNIGLVVAFGILVLLSINVYRYFTTPHLSVYEVQAGSAGSKEQTIAMVLREETVYRTNQAGYLNYYYREGARITKGAGVYSVNDSSNLQDLLNRNEETSVLSLDNLNRLKGSVRDFFAAYSDTSFSDSYILREKFLSDYLRYRDVSLLESLSKQNVDVLEQFQTVYSEKNGIVSYYTDCYDGYTKEQITGEEFSEEKRTVPEYSKQSGILGTDSFAYKLITDENWQLVIQVNETCMERLRKEGDSISFRILGDRVLYTKPYEVLKAGQTTYLLVEMDSYGNDYLNTRFLEITVFLSARDGLKIPATSIIQKEVYQIPERFVMPGGGEVDSIGISMEAYDAKSGEIKPEYQQISPLFYENGYYYVATEDFSADRYIYSSGLTQEPERAMLYSFLTNLEGVYNMNNGYAVFKRIERLTDLEDYILVRAGLAGGVVLYDHIVLDASAVTKDVILVEGE